MHDDNTINETDPDHRIAELRQEIDRLVAEVRLAHVDAMRLKLYSVLEPSNTL